MKYYLGYDDYELLYLIKNNNELALETLINKYIPFIEMTVRKLDYNEANFEDYVEEGKIILLRAIKGYNDAYCKTFLRYFELILLRDLYKIIRKDRNEECYKIIYEYPDNSVNAFADKKQEYQKDIMLNSDIEKNIYANYFLENCSIEYICSRYKYSAKQVYNAISRIKKKL